MALASTNRSKECGSFEVRIGGNGEWHILVGKARRHISFEWHE
jgi:hypothetical protein